MLSGSGSLSAFKFPNFPKIVEIDVVPQQCHPCTPACACVALMTSNEPLAHCAAHQKSKLIPKATCQVRKSIGMPFGDEILCEEAGHTW